MQNQDILSFTQEIFFWRTNSIVFLVFMYTEKKHCLKLRILYIDIPTFLVSEEIKNLE